MLKEFILNSDNLDKLAVFIEHGADVNAKDNEENTPLQLASSLGIYSEFQFHVRSNFDFDPSSLQGI